MGALVGLGIPEYEAKRYEGRVKHGGILFSVHCDSHDWVKRAEDILKRTGAEDISSSTEAHADYATSDRPMARTRSSIVDDRADDRVDRGDDRVADARVSDVTVTDVDPPEPTIIRTAGSGTTREP